MKRASAVNVSRPSAWPECGNSVKSYRESSRPAGGSAFRTSAALGPRRTAFVAVSSAMPCASAQVIGRLLVIRSTATSQTRLGFAVFVDWKNPLAKINGVSLLNIPGHESRLRLLAKAISARPLSILTFRFAIWSFMIASRICNTVVAIDEFAGAVNPARGRWDHCSATLLNGYDRQLKFRSTQSGMLKPWRKSRDAAPLNHFVCGAALHFLVNH